MKVYVAMDIGCIECGQDSKCLGVFKHEDQAIQAIKNAEIDFETNPPYPYGQHNFEYFEMEF